MFQQCYSATCLAPGAGRPELCAGEFCGPAPGGRRPRKLVSYASMQCQIGSLSDDDLVPLDINKAN